MSLEEDQRGSSPLVHRRAVTGKRGRQFAFAISDDAKVELEIVSTLLGKSQTAVIVETIHQLYESIPQERRTRLAKLRRELGLGLP